MWGPICLKKHGGPYLLYHYEIIGVMLNIGSALSAQFSSDYQVSLI
jgi:hypothetical protein